VNKVDVIIPARNEEATIGHVVEAFYRHPSINRIRVVADACTDETAMRASLHGADTVDVGVWNSKGEAVSHVLNFVETERVMFCDGDLRNLTPAHIEALVNCESVGMAIGVPDIPSNMPTRRLWAWPWVSGERVVPTRLVRPLHLVGYLMETQINSAAHHARLPLRFQKLQGCISPFTMSTQRLADMDRDLALGKKLGILP
jgi:glycosyltransferase involved in cell wall biosynthesis